ncbi:hypothetical protein EMQ25_08340 [Arsenicitalea aurantiaca]|uniref:Magnesium transporter MgtE intracellular domain-containing protein n=1 Tax=Arsenicitalea aurantiaca TaxID=1783274 RepID=A0A433XG86_9HYPH|nr:hypothetical protein [Arsenicitalea aurantiaca]RUT33121.1 hypothetical protein EMQ25_08340 [Arsenicitalea aurantiaca]
MKQVRLLPVVICAAGALLVLKGFGLVTQGGYVLTGVGAAVAQVETDVAITDPTVALPPSPTLDDNRPVLSDVAPTLAAPVATTLAETPALPAMLDCGDVGPGLAVEHMAGCGPDGQQIDPQRLSSGSDNERALLERLGERRGDIEAREAELAMRASLVEAAERRLEERAAALEALETRINDMVADRDAEEEGTFLALVGMYEQMKPRDAAGIFNTLDGQVLLRVARAMNPRKMAPIMAGMNPQRAQELTVMLAAGDPVRPSPASLDPMADLPQIVGR